MIDHITIDVSDLAKSTEFYREALRPLGYEIVSEFTLDQGVQMVGFGANNKPDYWIVCGARQVTPLTQNIHIALRAKSAEAVDAFHAAALLHGGIDNGKPGPRPHYHEHYYGAFVFDPDGINLEAVCHTWRAKE